MAREWILHQDRNGKFIFSIDNIGQFWDKKGNEIDLVVYNETEKKILFLECKLSPSKINIKLIEKLKEKAKSVKWMKSVRKEYFGVCTIGIVNAKIKNELKRQGIIIYELQ